MKDRRREKRWNWGRRGMGVKDGRWDGRYG